MEDPDGNFKKGNKGDRLLLLNNQVPSGASASPALAPRRLADQFFYYFNLHPFYCFSASTWDYPASLQRRMWTISFARCTTAFS